MERTVVMHRFAASCDGRLRVVWEPMFLDGPGGEPVVGAGARPDKHPVPFSELVAVVELNSGVLAHASARRLDRAGWRIADGAVRPDGGVHVAAVVVPSCAAALEELRNAFRSDLGTGVAQISHAAVQQWTATRQVDFLEFFDGTRALTLAVRAEGETAGEGIDRVRPSYGHDWDLTEKAVRARARWLICELLRPRSLHIASPCTRWCVLGVNQPGELEYQLRDLAVECLLHQESVGALGSHETPRAAGCSRSGGGSPRSARRPSRSTRGSTPGMTRACLAWQAPP